MPLYFQNIESSNIIFSDKHYRDTAKEDLIKFCEYVKEINQQRTWVPLNFIFHDEESLLPYINFIITKESIEKRIAIEYGVRPDYDNKKYEAACREQVGGNEIMYNAGNLIVEIKTDTIYTIVDIGKNGCECEDVNGDIRCFKFGEIRKYDAKDHINMMNEAYEGEDFLQKYITDACRTECDYSDAVSRAANYIDLLHGIIGLCTEIGELQDQIKRFVFYGKDLDVINIEEELGDLQYYIAIICKCLDLNLQRIFEKNIEKLKKRYPEGFSQDKALNRSVTEERKVLEA